MDIGLFIIIMVVLYVIPELLKRFRKKKPYQYPEFPQAGERPENAGMPGALSQGVKPPPVPVYATAGERTPVDDADPYGNTKTGVPVLVHLEPVGAQTGLYSLSSQGAIQGIVWAEVIAPPVALRRRSYGRRKL